MKTNLSILLLIVLCGSCASSTAPAGPATNNPGKGSTFNYVDKGFSKDSPTYTSRYARIVNNSDVSYLGVDHVFSYTFDSFPTSTAYRRSHQNGDYDYFSYFFKENGDTVNDSFGRWTFFPLSNPPGYYPVVFFDTSFGNPISYSIGIDIIGHESLAVGGQTVDAIHYIQYDSLGSRPSVRMSLNRKIESWYAPALGQNVKNITGIKRSFGFTLDSMISFTLK